jgi:ATP-dependent DNA helicase RecG
VAPGKCWEPANLDDGSVLEEARDEAADILCNDPDLNHHPVLRCLLDDQRNRVTSAAQLN